MKIKKINLNNRKKHFEIITSKQEYIYPYVKLRLKPTSANKINSVYVDKELANEAFTYVLSSGEEDSVHIDQVLDYNKDPVYLTEMLIYRLTLLLQENVKSSDISLRQIAETLGTSPAQITRLLDQSNYNKSVQQMLTILHLLNCHIEFTEVDSKYKTSKYPLRKKLAHV